MITTIVRRCFGSLPAGRALALFAALAALLEPALAQQTSSAAPPHGLSVEASTQIAALLVAKESRSPAQLKIDSQLLYATSAVRRQAVAVGVPQQEVNLIRSLTNASVVLVEFKAIISEELISAIKSSGGEIVNSYPKDGSLLAWVSLVELEALAARPEVNFIYPAPKVERDTGSVNSEGDRALAADTARSTFLPNTAGVKIGVISDSATAAGIAASVASGNLASGQVTVVPGQNGTGTDEGLAMLEIVNDVCPGAQLFFAASGNTEASFAANIRALRNTYNCDIIVDDVRMSPESPFQDGPVARAVNEVTGSGALYFCAAGNAGRKSNDTSGVWVGDFVDGGAITITVGSNLVNYRIHSFQTTPSVQNYDVVVAGGGGYDLSLFWADPEGASSNDYDIFQLDSAGTTVVSSSTNPQTGTQNPYENAALSSAGGNRIIIVQRVGAQARALHLNTFRGRLSINTAGFARGHSNAANAIPVAAAPATTAQSAGGPAGPFPGSFTAAQQLESFSSDGPIRKFFNADGTAVTPGNFLIGTGGGSTAQFPIFTAADGVVTSVPGFARFFGTSAAAPHAAAVAGLIKAYKPGLTAAQIRAAMVNSALDIMTPGTDSDSGAGIIRPVQALTALTDPPLVVITTPGHNSAIQALTTISGTVTDPNGLGFSPNQVSLNLSHVPSGDYWNGTAWTATQSTLAAPISGGTWTLSSGLPSGANARTGQYALSAFATNSAGVVSQPTSGGNNILFTVDTTPPVLGVTSPANGSIVMSLAGGITGTATDADSVAVVSVFLHRTADNSYWNGSVWVPFTGTYPNLTTTLSPGAFASNVGLPSQGNDPTNSLINGDYEVIAVAQDRAGNQSQVNVYFSVEFVIRWTGATLRDTNPNNDSTYWDTAANWLPMIVPGPNDIAQIDNGDRVDSTVDRTVRGLRLSGTSNLNTYTVTVTGGPGTSVWSGGTIVGPLIVASGAALRVDTSGAPYLNNTTLTNAGTITVMTSVPGNGQAWNGNSSTVFNQSGGRIEIVSDGLALRNVSTPPLIRNQAGSMFVKTNAASGRSTVNWVLDNDGTVGADAGTLAFDQGSSAAGSSGAFNSTVASARLEFAGGTHVLKTGARFTGPGRGALSAGSLTVFGSATIGTGGQGAGGFEVTGGTMEGAGSLSLIGGSGSLAWTGGAISTSFSLGAGSVSTIDSSGAPYLNNGTLTNAGTITVTASAPANGQSWNGNSSTLVNLSGGRIEIARDGLALRNVSTPPLIDNRLGAVFVKTTAASGRSTVNWVTNNDGTIGADTGTLAFDQGSSAAGSSGAFNSTIAAARIEFANGTHVLKTGARFTGPGRGALSAGSLTVSGSATIGTSGQAAGGFEVTGGTMDGAGSLSLIGGSGSLAWTGGAISTSFSLGAGSVSTIDSSGAPYLNNGTLTNAGTITVTASAPANGQSWNGNSSTLVNLSGGRIEIARDGLALRNVSTPPLIDNRLGAVFVKTAAASGRSTINWLTNNDGTVGADAGTLAFDQGSSAAGSSGAFNSALATARVEFANGTHVLKTGARFTGPGRGALSAGSLTVSGTATIGTSGQAAGGFEVTGGTMDGAGSLSLIGGSGSLAWTGGAISTSFSLGAGSISTIDSSGAPYLNNGTLTNAGTITVTASAPANGQSWLGNNSTLVNLSGGRIEIARDGLALRNNSTPPLIDNRLGAVFVKTAAATGRSTVNWVTNNDGTVGADAGTLAFDQGSSAAGSSGVFNSTIAAARIEFANGTHVLKTGARFTGPGRGALSAGSLTVSGTATIGTSGQAAGGFEVTGGTMDGAGSLSLIGGSGSLAWTGGAISTSFSLGAGSVSTIDSSGAPYLNNGTLTNAGTITVTASAPANGQSWLGNNSTLVNLSGGRIEIARDGLALRNNSTAPLIDNRLGAVFVKTAAASGRSTINWLTNNDGTIGADAGTLAFDAGSSAAGSSGVFTSSAAAARVEFAGGNHVLKTGAIFTGPGRGKLSAGSLTVSGTSTIGTSGQAAGGFDLNAGTMDGGGNLSVIGGGGTFALNGGQLSTTLIIATGSVMAVDTTGGPSLNGGLLNNSGVMTIGSSDPNNLGTLAGNSFLITNLPAGRIEFARDGQIFRNFSTPPIVINSGTMAKTAGTGTTDFGTFSLTQRGVLTLPANTVLHFTDAVTFDVASQITGGKVLFDATAPNVAAAIGLSAGATLEISGGGLTAAVDGQGMPLGSINGPGTFSWKAGAITGKLNLGSSLVWEINTIGNPYLNGATINLAGSASVSGGSGALQGNNSTLNIAAGGLFQVKAATTFTNVSTAPTIVNAGTFKIGGPAAILTSGWNYTQTSTGVIDFEIGGANPATPQYSQFQLSTPTQLAGQLRVTRVNGYSPPLNTTFTLMTFPGNSGTFASTSGLGLGNGLKLTSVVTASSVTLNTVVSAFGDWQAARFGPNAGNPAIAGPLATPAGDGIVNALKYAFNLDPFTDGSKKMPKAGIFIDPVTGFKHLGITFRRLIGASDPIYVPRVSSSLSGAWDASGAQVEQFGGAVPVGDGVTETVTFRLMTPMQPGSQGFLDVEVDYL